MSYKCRVCGLNDVEYPGDICDMCALGRDPYASSMASSDSGKYDMPSATTISPDTTGTVGKGKSRKVLLNGGASLVYPGQHNENSSIQSEETEAEVPVYSAGQVPAQKTNSWWNPNKAVSKTVQKKNKTKKNHGIIASGITKNISTDMEQKSFLWKLCHALFYGIPFARDNSVTLFQVFPDYSGTSTNSMGNACDQVIIYGRVKNGAIAENNDIKVYGHRDSKNNIIARKIQNKASGTTVVPDGTISATLIRAIVVFIVAPLFVAVVWSLQETIGIAGVIVIAAIIILICRGHVSVLLGLVKKMLHYIYGIVRKIFR